MNKAVRPAILFTDLKNYCLTGVAGFHYDRLIVGFRNLQVGLDFIPRGNFHCAGVGVVVTDGDGFDLCGGAVWDDEKLKGLDLGGGHVAEYDFLTAGALDAVNVWSL